MYLIPACIGYAQSQNPKHERITVKRASEKTSKKKKTKKRKELRPRQRRKLQTVDLLKHDYVMRKRMTARERRQVEESSVDGDTRKDKLIKLKEKKKEIKKKKKINKYLDRKERAQHRRHMRLQEPDVRKRMRKNFRKTKKEFIELQQQKRKSPLNKKPGRQKKRKQHTHPKP